MSTIASGDSDGYNQSISIERTGMAESSEKVKTSVTFAADMWRRIKKCSSILEIDFSDALDRCLREGVEAVEEEARQKAQEFIDEGRAEGPAGRPKAKRSK